MDNDSKRQQIDQLVNSNLNLVTAIARRYLHRGLDLDDLISEGNMGLVMAAEKYDAAKGIPFEKFASSWIRSSITAGLAAHSRPIKLNKAENHQLKQLNKMQRQFETSEERRPSVSEMAQLTKIRQKEVAEIMLASMRHKSVDAPLSSGTKSTLLDVSPIAKDDEHDTLDTRLQLSTITSSLSLLDERERNVLTAYFGIGEIELTMQEIADKYGLKRERVRQIRDKALRKLRKLQQSKI